jgi:pimeloyl-ACP methyl ester carboxylesterase
MHFTNYGTANKAVVLIHGWTCDETVWRAQVTALQPEYRVITIDLPGHGKSERPSVPFTQDLFAWSVRALLAEAKVEKAVLVGHSMGGLVIRRFGELYPQQTVALVTVDAPYLLAPTGRFAERAGRFGGEGGLAAREKFVQSMFSASACPELRREITDLMLKATEATAVGAFQSMQDPNFGSGPPLTMPVLAIAASPDIMGEEIALKKLFSNLTYCKTEAGHFAMLEKPDEFNSLLLAFLAGLRF